MITRDKTDEWDERNAKTREVVKTDFGFVARDKQREETIYHYRLLDPKKEKLACDILRAIRATNGDYLDMLAGIRRVLSEEAA